MSTTLTLLALFSLATGPAQQAEPTDLLPALQGPRLEFDIPGMGAAVVSGGELVAIGTAGLRAKSGRAEVTNDDKWHLGSCTKAMTATLVAKLAEKGVVQLDSTVASFFPDMTVDEAWSGVTLEELLQHRGGVRKDPMDLWEDLQRRGVATKAREFLAMSILAAPPTETTGKTLYSNLGYTLVAAALEAKTGRSWEQLMRDELFTPLGMTSAGFGAPGSASSFDQPRGHRFVEAMGGDVAVMPGKNADNPNWMAPAGGVHASLADWAKFVTVHLAGARDEPSSYLTRESLGRLQRPARSSAYASGWRVEKTDWSRGDALWHNGSNTLWFSIVYVAPELDMAILVTANSAGDNARKACDAAVKAVYELMTQSAGG